MIVEDLTGRKSKLKVSGKQKAGKKKSKLHEKAIDVIRQMYPLCTICNEVPIKIRPGCTLYIDIFLPGFNVAIEVNGRQHFEFVPMYHKYEHRFGRSQLNDNLKKQWCHLNEIGIIQFNYDDEECWYDKLARATGKIGQNSN